jgi:hypothetical protein
MQFLILILGFLKVYLVRATATALQAADTTGVPVFPEFDERFNMVMIVGIMIIVLIFLLSLKIYQLETGRPEREERN